MDASLKRLVVGRIGVTILGDLTEFLDNSKIPKEDWPDLMIDAVIFIFERGEAMLEQPFLDMLKARIEEYQKERKNAQQISEGNV